MKFSKYLICFCLIACLNSAYICASETSVTNNVVINEVENVDNKELEDKKADLKKEILELVEELRIGIVTIDEKIETLRKTDEYINYPTIRLNIDTPIFGIKSIVNQKLRITKDVSAGDVAKGYSIRDIIKNKTVKVIDFKLGNIVVSTKEYNIEDELSITEYNSLVLKLMNYIDKVESVNGFLDTQTNKIFKEYISKEKQEKLKDFSTRLKKIGNDLLEKNSELLKIYFIQNDSYNKLEEKYIELAKKHKELQVKSSDVLIENNKLNELQKNILSLETEFVDFSADIDSINNNILENVKIDEVYIKVYNELKNKLEYIEKYKEDSKVEKEVKNEEQIIQEIDDENENENKEESKVEEKEEVITTEIVILHEVFSDKSINNLEKIIADIEKKMEELDIPYNETKENIDSDIETENESINAENIEENKEQEELAYESLEEEQIQNELNYITQKYNEFLKYEYSFYLDNINGLLELTNIKVKNIAAVTETDIISEAKYVYIDLPLNLDKYLDTYNVNSNTEIKYLISNLKKELEKLRESYLNLSQLYEKLNVDELLNEA